MSTSPVTNSNCVTPIIVQPRGRSPKLTVDTNAPVQWTPIVSSPVSTPGSISEFPPSARAPFPLREVNLQFGKECFLIHFSTCDDKEGEELKALARRVEKTELCKYIQSSPNSFPRFGLEIPFKFVATTLYPFFEKVPGLGDYVKDILQQHLKTQ